MSLSDYIDFAVETTPYGRPPCLECALKHLGSAWFARDASPATPAVLLARVEILLDESESGYPAHRHLAVGILNHLERFSRDRAEARRLRRLVYAGNRPDLSAYPLPDSVPPPTADERLAHRIEAMHECPSAIDLETPECVLIERLSR